MHNLYIDPFLVAVPEDIKPTEFEDYVQTLITWRDIINEEWIDVYSSSSMYEFLHRSGAYPIRDHIEKLITILDVRDVQTRDIVTLVDALIYKTLSIEDEANIVSLACDEINFTPKEHTSIRPAIFKDAYAEILILIALTNETQKRDPQKNIFVTRHLPHDYMMTEIKGDYLCEVRVADDIDEISGSIDAEVPCCNSPKGLFLAVNPVVMLSEHRNEESFRRAIWCYILHLAASGGSVISEEDLSSWSIGREFVESANRLGFLHDDLKVKMLLRTCTEIIGGENKRYVHALRTGKGGDNPQKKRGQDKAWRCDIDHEYHIHYWETSKGPELAVVVPHNDFDIPE